MSRHHTDSISNGMHFPSQSHKRMTKGRFYPAMRGEYCRGYAEILGHSIENLEWMENRLRNHTLPATCLFVCLFVLLLTTISI
ncbi:hypothetical protein M431DRAFT_420254 [Trichoderma harzianum CBS 226.95]|uniref:Uncharacterized protein n=1 Tax=Trichoderma harzianum CBS 226.95 TaxID=983964 RepID=A0A2T3ZRK0_TRIHA|nr:hypothetical protein M431DRAFT_420254 [Trichoderma harzianum CBS 226.95]PTB47439.1 hypothetical protein M431DRAFT_420254 [Trichoderma harzianum CBS 226.95]